MTTLRVQPLPPNPPNHRCTLVLAPPPPLDRSGCPRPRWQPYWGTRAAGWGGGGSEGRQGKGGGGSAGRRRVGEGAAGEVRANGVEGGVGPSSRGHGGHQAAAGGWVVPPVRSSPPSADASRRRACEMTREKEAMHERARRGGPQAIHEWEGNKSKREGDQTENQSEASESNPHPSCRNPVFRCCRSTVALGTISPCRHAADLGCMHGARPSGQAS